MKLGKTYQSGKAYLRNQPPIPCKCGTIPEIGMTFYYTSKYDGSVVEGVIAETSFIHIISTQGAMYKNEEVEIKPVHIRREERLNDLGI